MPLRTRDAVKQDLERSKGNIDSAKEKIGRWIDTYKEHHPDIAGAMHIATEYLEQCKKFIDSINEAI